MPNLAEEFYYKAFPIAWRAAEPAATPTLTPTHTATPTATQTPIIGQRVYLPLVARW